MSRTASGTITGVRLPQTLRRMDDRVIDDRFRRRTTAGTGTTRGDTLVVERPERELVVDDGYAAVVHVALSTVVGKLSGGELPGGER